MSRRTKIALGVAAGVAALTGVLFYPLPVHVTPAGQASGEMSYRSHQGVFLMHPSYCRNSVNGTGAGVYSQAEPALAFGYFNIPDAGEWVEAQGPGVIGATRFDKEDCPVFEVSAAVDGGLTYGRAMIVCDAPKSPGIIHAEGEVRFSACGRGMPQ